MTAQEPPFFKEITTREQFQQWYRFLRFSLIKGEINLGSARLELRKRLTQLLTASSR